VFINPSCPNLETVPMWTELEPRTRRAMCLIDTGTLLLKIRRVSTPWEIISQSMMSTTNIYHHAIVKVVQQVGATASVG